MGEVTRFKNRTHISYTLHRSLVSYSLSLISYSCLFLSMYSFIFLFFFFASIFLVEVFLCIHNGTTSRNDLFLIAIIFGMRKRSKKKNTKNKQRNFVIRNAVVIFHCLCKTNWEYEHCTPKINPKSQRQYR